MIKLLIITHGNLGREVLVTAENIVGKQEDVQVVNVTREDLQTMCRQTGEILNAIENPEGTLVLTDMLGGTPCNACLPFSTDHKIEIITGLNLYMMLSALLNRRTLALDELAKKVLCDGQKNIANAREIFLNKLR
jgi:PTS system mannose-specific IIA component